MNLKLQLKAILTHGLSEDQKASLDYLSHNFIRGDRSIPNSTSDSIRGEEDRINEQQKKRKLSFLLKS